MTDVEKNAIIALRELKEAYKGAYDRPEVQRWINEIESHRQLKEIRSHTIKGG